MGKSATPLRSARNFCFWCGNGQVNEVLLCPADKCVLWKFRKGKGGKKLEDIRKKCVDCDDKKVLGIANMMVNQMKMREVIKNGRI